MKKISFVVGIILCAAFLVGCGETIQGAGRDISRIGYGVKTIFVSQH